jgi:hypothetical protein
VLAPNHTEILAVRSAPPIVDPFDLHQVGQVIGAQFRFQFRSASTGHVEIVRRQKTGKYRIINDIREPY